MFKLKYILEHSDDDKIQISSDERDMVKINMVKFNVLFLKQKMENIIVQHIEHEVNIMIR